MDADAMLDMALPQSTRTQERKASNVYKTMIYGSADGAMITPHLFECIAVQNVSDARSPVSGIVPRQKRQSDDRRLDRQKPPIDIQGARYPANIKAMSEH